MKIIVTATKYFKTGEIESRKAENVSLILALTSSSHRYIYYSIQ